MTEEPLFDDVTIFVSKNHTFSTDSILLAHFASIKHKDTAVDLGSGTGIIPFLETRFCQNKIFAVEILPEGCELMKNTIEKNHLNGQVEVLNIDMADAPNVLKKGTFSLVTANPPYKKQGDGILSQGGADRVIRHETAMTLDSLFSSASALLKFGGRLCFCQRPERLCDIFTKAREFDLEPKRIRFVSKNKNTPPWLVLVEAKKGAKPFLEVCPSLFLYEPNGEKTDEHKEIFAFYQNNGHKATPNTD